MTNKDLRILVTAISDRIGTDPKKDLEEVNDLFLLFVDDPYITELHDRLSLKVKEAEGN